ncbi:MAG: serine/threonine-protein phosphatase [Clostridiaceae bacterium]|nr:serine/threonine-protein phosphatase [Clostridiaceae bacterium]
MHSFTAYHTDVGIHKKINEDSLSIQVADTAIGEVVFAVVCDGMGGLQRGELASANVTRAFAEWFETDFPTMILDPNLQDKIFEKWAEIISTQNRVIADYGALYKIVLGTTASVLLMLESGKFFIGHVGDSRVYCINQSVHQLTDDQTVVNKEVKNGRLTIEQAESDPRRNVLLQCVGASPTLVPDFMFGDFSVGDMFLLCSDGFRHEISLDEITSHLNPAITRDEESMRNALVDLIELNKQRGERDNITALAILVS